MESLPAAYVTPSSDQPGTDEQLSYILIIKNSLTAVSFCPAVRERERERECCWGGQE